MKKLITCFTRCALLVAVFSLLLTHPLLAADTGTTMVMVGSSSSDVAPPTSLPLSLRAITAYAWEQASFVQAYAWSSGQINQAGDTNYLYLSYSKTNGMVNQRDVLRMIAAARLRVSNLHSNDTIGFEASVHDKDGYQLFYGGNQGLLNQAPAGTIATNIFGIKIYIDSQIWITVTNLSYAQIVERDANGNVVRYSSPYISQLGNGVSKLLYDLYFAQNKYGEMILIMNNGTQVAYDLHTSKKIVPKQTDVSVSSVTAPGNYYAENTNQVGIIVSQEEYAGKLSPLLQYVNSTATTNFVFFSATLPTGETQASIRIWKQGSDPSSAEELGVYQNSTWSLKAVPPGYWWIEFKFTSGFGNDAGYKPPYDYYGYGKGG